MGSSIFSKTNKKSGIFILVLVFPFMSGAQDSLNWQSESGFSYAYQLNDSFLVWQMQIPPGQLQNQILLCGLNLWLEPAGKKKLRKGLLYPLGLPQQKIPSNPILFVRFLENLSMAERQKLATPPEMLVIGFYSGEKDDVINAPANTPGALSVSCRINEENTLFYEAQIPLSIFGTFQHFRCAWETGELERPEMRGSDAVGLDEGPISSPETRSERENARYLDTYRLYGDETKWRSRKISLARE